MHRILCLCLLLLVSLSAGAQQPRALRSDTLNFSVQARYLLVSVGAGVEFPFRQHSFGLQASLNHVPVNGNIYVGFNTDKIAALEYKRYYSSRTKPNKQYYYGSYILLKEVAHDSPHDADYHGDWYETSSVNIGPLWGVKRYAGPRVYFDLFLGIHGGWQWGSLRWDNRDPASGIRNPSYGQDSGLNWGLRLGLSMGVHPFRKKE